jgi:hypothetical protein
MDSIQGLQIDSIQGLQMDSIQGLHMDSIQGLNTGTTYGLKTGTQDRDSMYGQPSHLNMQGSMSLLRENGVINPF